MFCPKCGTQLPDNAGFCASCGAKIGGTVTVKEEFKHLTYREMVVFILASILALFAFLPIVDPFGSLLATETFKVHALFGIAKIFIMLSLGVYAFYAVSCIIDMGIPSKVKKILMLCFLGVYSFGQLFVLIGSFVLNDATGWFTGGAGVTPGAAWYIMLGVLALAYVLFFVPRLIKDKK